MKETQISMFITPNHHSPYNLYFLSLTPDALTCGKSIKKGKNHPTNAIKVNIMKCHSRLTQRRASPLPAVTLLNDIQSLKLHFLDYPVSQERHQVLHNFPQINLFVV